MRGYYGNVAFPPRNQPELPFHAADGLTGGLPDVRTEMLRSMALIRRSGLAIKAPSFPYQSGAFCLPTKFAEEIKGSTPMGPATYPTTGFAPPAPACPGSAGPRWIAAMAAALAV